MARRVTRISLSPHDTKDVVERPLFILRHRIQFGDGLSTRSMTMNSRGALIGSTFSPSCASAVWIGGAVGRSAQFGARSGNRWRSSWQRRSLRGVDSSGPYSKMKCIDEAMPAGLARCDEDFYSAADFNDRTANLPLIHRQPRENNPSRKMHTVAIKVANSAESSLSTNMKYIVPATAMLSVIII